MTQQTMTKEQILESKFYRPENMDWYKPILNCMEIYKEQEVAKEREKYEARILETIESMDDIMKEELSKEREKAKKLVEALEEIADMTGNILIYKKAKQSLTEYEKL